MQMVITGDDAVVLRSFHAWLRDDVDVARSAKVSLVSAGGAGDMGAVEIINVVLANTIGLGNLVLAYTNWRRTRTDPPSLTLAVESEKVTPRDDSTEELRRINETFSGWFEEGQSHD